MLLFDRHSNRTVFLNSIKKREMKKFLCLMMILCTAGIASAQMTAAKRIPPAVEKKVVLKASAQKVWDYMSEPGNYRKFSGVKTFTCEEKALNAKIELETKAGKKRSQHISVIDYDNFKICYFVTKSDYAGEKQWVYAFDIYPKGDGKCEVVLSVFFGFDELSPEFKEGITKEFDDIVSGLKKKCKS